MSRQADERKAALKERLIAIAEARIAQAGLSAVRARDLAAEAGCSVGAIYNVFEDLDALIMAVNGRTFQALGRSVKAAVDAAGTIAPRAQLIVMSNAYLAFAAEHNGLWRALFDLNMTADEDVPDWYLQELQALFALIAAPLRVLYPDRDLAGLDLLVRTLFSAVHGIVLLGLERRISAVPQARIEEMIGVLLGEFGQ